MTPEVHLVVMKNDIAGRVLLDSELKPFYEC